jgi:molecular chaperone Hsp33
MTDFAPTESLLTPFMLEGGHVRGRIVYLADVANIILSRYEYPKPVVKLLGELIVVASMLSSNLKQNGVFTIQIRGNGLIPLIVVDAVYGGAIRGYAEVNEAAAEKISEMKSPTPRDIVGQDSYLAITLDAGEDMQRYQGIVALEGDSVADAFMQYFTRSEQLDVQLQLAVSESAPWSAGGMIVERMPTGSDEAAEANLEAWRYASALMGTVKSDELLDPLLDAQVMLYRLFHEEGVRVYPAHLLSVGCRCSRQRIYDLLMSMDMTDRADMILDGKASVHCQFCNKSELFTPEELGLGVKQ